MNLSSSRKLEFSPVTTRYNTSTRGSVCSPNKNLNILTQFQYTSDKFKSLQYGSTWKQFVLPQFKSKNLGQSISTICSPRKNKKQSQFSIPKQVNELTRLQTFGVNPSMNSISQSYSFTQLQTPNYLKEQTQYLRDEIQKLLIQKYKPGAKTLY